MRERPACLRGPRAETTTSRRAAGERPRAVGVVADTAGRSNRIAAGLRRTTCPRWTEVLRVPLSKERRSDCAIVDL